MSEEVAYIESSRREKIGREVSWCSEMLRPDAVTELQDTVDSSIKQLVRGSASCEAVYVQPTLFDPMTSPDCFTNNESATSAASIWLHREDMELCL